MSQIPVTRFAPSPTGFLHIGGARTALFNWLYARAHKGRYLLRIEDTDRTRSTDAAVHAILDGLEWMGLHWDDAPVFQHKQADRHREVVHQLLGSGHAYKCYASPEELAAMREKARAEGRAPGYDGTWRNKDESEAPEGVAPVIRFKSPQEGETMIRDAVQGDVRFDNKNLDDFILLRSDGSPTYMMSVVVDDHDMEVTMIIRGDDHLTNAARQTQLYEALGWTPPGFAHIPLIHGPDGAKLSKRHGALGIEAYRAMGYLPAALRNYLVRLGWSHGNDEIISDAQMLEWFNLENIGKSPARFDFKKLGNLNGHYIKTSDDDELVMQIKTSFAAVAAGPDLEEGFQGDDGKALWAKIKSVTELCESLKESDWQKLRAAMPGLKERAKTLVDLMDSARYLFVTRPIPMHPKAAKHLTDTSKTYIEKLLPQLEALEDWNTETIEQTLRDFMEAEDIKLGKIAQPLRAAASGQATSPGIFDVLSVLGKDESLNRIKDQLE